MLEREFEQKIHQAFPHGQAFLVGLSGGVDSVVLLHLLAKVCQKSGLYTLRAIHIHHGLSPNGDKWQAFCQQICQKKGIPFVTEKLHLASPHQNVEETARLARYGAVARHLSPQEIFVTAHHLDDQVETFFLALKRGSGLQGLSAMQALSQMGDVAIFRPLLPTSRKQIEAYANAYALQWVEDESNQDVRYDRNFLRHHILPVFTSRWEHFPHTVQRTANLCGEQQALIDELLAPIFGKFFDKNRGVLNVQDFPTFSPAKQNALLRMWLQQLGQKMPSQKQLAQIKQDVIFAKADRTPCFMLGERMIRRYQHTLYLTPFFADVRAFSMPLSEHCPVHLPDALGCVHLEKQGEHLKVSWQCGQEIRCTQLPATSRPITVRFAYAGNVKQANGMQESLKKCWQKANVPPWQRQRIPLIFYGECFQCAVGYFVHFA